MVYLTEKQAQTASKLGRGVHISSLSAVVRFCTLWYIRAVLHGPWPIKQTNRGFVTLVNPT